MWSMERMREGGVSYRWNELRTSSVSCLTVTDFASQKKMIVRSHSLQDRRMNVHPAPVTTSSLPRVERVSTWVGRSAPLRSTTVPALSRWSH
jgi:hypothetical protein